MLPAALLAAALAGCSVREYAARSLGDALAQGGDVYGADDDIEFVGAAIPFGLKTVESLLAVTPDHRGLLLAAARGFTQYGFVYIQSVADELEDRDVAAAYAQRARARRMYLRARDYGLRGLGLGVSGGQVPAADLRQRLAAAKRDDVPLAYWTAIAWAAAISLGKDDPRLLAGLPAVDALVARAADLDPDFDAGALHTFLIGYQLSRPDAAPDAEAQSRRHFERAIELSEGRQAAPYVALAEAVALPRRDRRAFESLLRSALAVDADQRPEWRLANLVNQRRARRLLDRAADLIPE
jgi:predicted anti-sigma-YlaC factor YlaD